MHTHMIHLHLHCVHSHVNIGYFVDMKEGNFQFQCIANCLVEYFLTPVRSKLSGGLLQLLYTQIVGKQLLLHSGPSCHHKQCSTDCHTKPQLSLHNGWTHQLSEYCHCFGLQESIHNTNTATLNADMRCTHFVALSEHSYNYNAKFVQMT